MIIEVNDLSLSYGGNIVLSEVNCKIEKGAFTVIMGNNGSGKSTLLRAMGGIVPYQSGSIKIDSQNLNAFSIKDRAKKVAFLSQNHHPVFPFKVSEVVLTGRASFVGYMPQKEDWYEVDKALERLGIEKIKNSVYSELSGGQRQLVMIARMLTQKSQILLMDEPINALDFNNQIKIIKIIKELVEQGITIVAVLHDPNLSYLYGDNFIYVHQKKLYEVKENPWEHPLVSEMFSDSFTKLNYKEKCIFVPNL